MWLDQAAVGCAFFDQNRPLAGCIFRQSAPVSDPARFFMVGERKHRA
jgi:hypothetical protein